MGGGGLYPEELQPQTDGSNSSFGDIIATGGGKGGSLAAVDIPGGNGGSGGGAGYDSGLGTGIVGQGYDGGSSSLDDPYPNGGGGGAGAVGVNGTGNNAGNGGVGLEYSQFSSVGGSPAGWFAGGGGGGAYNVGGIGGGGGQGGGGNGAANNEASAGSGVANTGGGGGGQGGVAGVYPAGNGGSGIVIVRYLTASGSATGGTITTSGLYTIHTFTNTTGTIITNDGAVTTNSGSITTNNSAINDNSGIVTTNSATGIVTTNNGTVSDTTAGGVITTNGVNGIISAGTFNTAMANDGTLTTGTFNALVTNTGTISGGIYTNGITFITNSTTISNSTITGATLLTDAVVTTIDPSNTWDETTVFNIANGGSYLGLNVEPTGIFNSATQKTDGTGKVDTSITVSDEDNDNSKAKIEYVAGAGCTGTWANATLVSPATSATYTPLPDISANIYQIGSTTPILTTGANTVVFSWDSKTDVPTANGTYCLRLTVNDGTVDQITPATTTVVLDNVAPDAPSTPDMTSATDSGSSSTDNITLDTTPDFTMSCETGATVTLYDSTTSVGTGACVSSTATITSSVLSSGTHAAMNAKQTDTAGNISTSSENLSIIIDTTAPTASTTAPTDSSTVSGDSVAISATASDLNSVAGVQFKLDINTNIGAEITSSPYETTWDSTGVSDGAHTIIAVARDVAGNYATSTEVNITVDNTPPVISSISPVNNSIISYGQTITFTLDEIGDCRLAASSKSYDGMSGDVSCSVSNGILISCATPNLGGNGTKNIYLACKDSQGNKDTAESATYLTYILHIRSLGGVSISETTSSPVSTGPQGPFSILINNGVVLTNQRQVTLNLSSGSSTSAVVLSTTPDFWTVTTIPYQNSYQFDLCQGKAECPDNSYNVYAKFLDASGVASPAVSAGINLNTYSNSIGGDIDLAIGKVVDTTKVVTNAITQTITSLIPTSNENIVYPPLEQSVPETAQDTFQNKWPITTPTSLNNYVFENLPSDFQNIVNKFPDVGITLQKIGITRMSDVSELSGIGSISLPGLSEIAGLSTEQNIALTDFSPAQINQIPTDVIFTRIASEGIDLNTKLSISNSGLTLQTLNTTAGQPLKFIIKPEGKADKVSGYIIFKSSGNPVSIKKSALTQTASVAFAMEDNTTDLVLNKFDYKDSGNGIWTAEVASPLALGQYELRTVVNYENKASPKTISMMMVVDPEGYVYKMDNGEETRIPNASVSMYWLNPKTNAYELWPAKDFRQENPQTTDVTGRYAFLVPVGNYYLKVIADGYYDYNGDQFKVEESKGVFVNIELNAKFSWLKILNFQTVLSLGIFIMLIYLIIIFTIRHSKKDKMLYN